MFALLSNPHCSSVTLADARGCVVSSLGRFLYISAQSSGEYQVTGMVGGDWVGVLD